MRSSQFGPYEFNGKATPQDLRPTEGRQELGGRPGPAADWPDCASVTTSHRNPLEDEHPRDARSNTWTATGSWVAMDAGAMSRGVVEWATSPPPAPPAPESGRRHPRALKRLAWASDCAGARAMPKPRAPTGHAASIPGQMSDDRGEAVQQQSATHRGDQGLGAVGGTELLVEVTDMCLDGRLAEIETARDVARPKTLCEQLDTSCSRGDSCAAAVVARLITAPVKPEHRKLRGARAA